jgi:adenine deaminase
MNNVERLLTVARGEAPADLLLKNAQIVNTFTGEIEPGNVAICEDRIAGVGDYDQARDTIDLAGQYLAPGLINGHTHIESSMLHPLHYAQTLLPRGTLAVVTDLHEIANVCGLAGIEFVRRWSRQLPLDILLMAPSCVPATPLETAGDCIDVDKLTQVLSYPGVIGLGEVMNFPAVIHGERQMLAKIHAASGKVVDGHAPGVTGKELNAYVAAGVRSDHESTTFEEGAEKLRRGMYLMVREGSSEKNLEALLPLVNDRSYRRCIFVVDDRSCADLLRDGDIDAVLRKAIACGLDPVRALQMATLNPAEHFRLHDRGGIAPGYLADLITIPDLAEMRVDRVFSKGTLVASGGKPVFPLPSVTPELSDTVRMVAPSLESLRLEWDGESFPVIEIVPGQITTRHRTEQVRKSGRLVVPDAERDLLKAAVLERHKATGNIGLGLVKGFGLKRGALASSVAHDSHNIVAVGASDEDIICAVDGLAGLHGGLVVSAGGEIIASLPLPVAGLLSLEPAEAVAARFEKVEQAARSLGTLPPAPFAILSFLALPVIPELRLTDRGLVDVTRFRLIS